MMPKVPPVQYSAMAPVHDDSNPNHSNPTTDHKSLVGLSGVHFSSLKLFHQQELPVGLQDRGAALPNLWGALEQRKEKALL